MLAGGNTLVGKNGKFTKPLLTSSIVIIVAQLFVLYVCSTLASTSTTTTFDWTSVDQVLDDAVAGHAFPGCVALIADKTGILYAKAKGFNIYAGSSDVPLRPMKIDTMFDMASVTKVLVTTSAVALLFQNGHLPSLKIRVSQIFPEFATNGKENITLENLMLHNSGLRADPIPGFYSTQFGCPETRQYHPELTFSCLDRIYEGTMSQPLANPIGTKFVYSDLSMITMMYVVGFYVKKNNLVSVGDMLPSCSESSASENKGKLACYFEAFVRKFIFEQLDMSETTFITADNVHRVDPNNIPPAWNDTSYRHELIHGYVSDGNAYALGGVSGHAGMFSTIMDIHKLVHKLMFPNTDQISFLTKETMEYFTTVKNLTLSSRAYGWDTNWDSLHEATSCGSLSPETYMHTGYTGTNTCNDPKRQLLTILLTNRVYPNDSDRQIIKVRTAFNSAVQQEYDRKIFVARSKSE